MKTRTSSHLFLTATIAAVLVLTARNVPAQDSTAASAAQTAPVQLSYGVSQIIQLSKAKVSEDTIVNYIRNSGSSYGMDASQIVYLKQQGVSDAVINTMLNQPRLTQTIATTAPQPAYPTASSTATETAAVVAQPAVTYVQTVPSSTVYVIPDTQTYRYYYNNYYQPAYGYYPYYSGWGYPAVSFSFGFGGGNRGGYYHGGWGGGYRGGYSGGYHGGGGFHGGGGWHR